jgi:hypothetical protein
VSDLQGEARGLMAPDQRLGDILDVVKVHVVKLLDCRRIAPVSTFICSPFSLMVLCIG